MWLAKHGEPALIIYRGTFGQIRSILNSQIKIEDVKSPKPLAVAKSRKVPFLFYMVTSIVVEVIQAFKIANLNKKYPFRVLHAVDLANDGFAAIIASWLTRVPVVSHCHGIRYYTYKECSKDKNYTFLRVVWASP